MTQTLLRLFAGLISERMLLGLARDVLAQVKEHTDETATEIDNFFVDALYNAVNRAYLQANAGEMRQGR